MKSSDLSLRWIRGACSVLMVFAFIGILKRIVFQSDVLPYFCDEIEFYTQSAYGFLTRFNYNSLEYPHPFDGTFNGGLLASWPCGIVWLFGGSLFQQRLLIAAVAGVSLYLVLKMRVFRDLKLSRFDFMALGLVAGLMTLHVPYAFGFLGTPGELQGAIYFLLAISWIHKRPLWAAFILGMVVWHVKFVFILMAVFLAGGVFFERWRAQNLKVMDVLRWGFSFLLPLLLWWLLIWVRFDFAAVSTWMKDFTYNIVFHMGGPQQWTNLSDRLRNLEWKNYDTGTQIKVLLLLFLPILFLAAAGGAHLFLKIKLRFSAIAVSLMLALLSYAYWYFFLHHLMWLRHLQPSLYLGLGLLFYWVLGPFKPLLNRILKVNRVLKDKRWLYVCLLIFLMFETKYFFSGSWRANEETYARKCKGTPYSRECVPEHRWQKWLTIFQA